MKKFRKITSVMLSIAIIFSAMSGIRSSALSSEANTIAISSSHRYLLADINYGINLGTINVSIDDATTVSGDTLTWTPSDADVTVEEGVITATTKGPHKVTVSNDTFAMDIYIVAKNAFDAEYQLYSENFDNIADGTLPAGWKRVAGKTVSKAAVVNKQFVIDASASPDNPSMVKLPDFLDIFGDYTVQADATITACNETSRWCSIVYRIQNPAKYYPYYQMAVRVNAPSSGVEFAEYTPSATWNVITKNSYSESINPAKMYTFKVQTDGTRVCESIKAPEAVGFTKVIDSNLATSYQTGGIGLQANGCKMVVDNLQVTIPGAPQKVPAKVLPIANVTEPVSNISNAPSIITEINNASDFDNLSGTLPATAILNVDKSLNIIGSDGKPICFIADALDKLNNSILPAFNVDDTDTIVVLSEYLNRISLYDAFIMSSDPTLVKDARVLMPKIRGIVDFNGLSGTLTSGQLLDIVRTTNRSDAKVALLSQSEATRSNVEYLQQRMITIWVKTDDNITDKSTIANIITTGVNGIASDSYKKFIDGLSFFSDKGSLVRKPFIVGHRGDCSVAPENTMPSVQKAYEAGADFVENDIWLTTDNQIAVMHDNLIQGTTNGSGSIETFTMDQLKQFIMTKYQDLYPNTRIPSLNEYFDYVKDKNLNIFVEIKSTNPAIVDVLVALIKNYNVEDHVVVISGFTNPLTLLHQKMPELPIGFLSPDSFPTLDLNSRIDKTISLVQSLNSTMNPSYQGIDKQYMDAMKNRGITVWPYTINDQSVFNTFFTNGANGITTDYSQWASDLADEITPVSDTYIIRQGKTNQLNAYIHTYNDKTLLKPVSIAYVDGDNILSANGTDIIANGTGTEKVMLKYTTTLSDGKSYSIYSSVVTVTVLKPQEILTFDSRGGSALTSITAEQGTSITEPANPTRAGYAFSGWYTAPSGGAKVTFPYSVTSNVTLYALWSYTPGDINGDGTIDLLDVTMLARNISGWKGMSVVTDAIDVNGDGTVDLKDVTALSRYIAGWNVVLH